MWNVIREILVADLDRFARRITRRPEPEPAYAHVLAEVRPEPGADAPPAGEARRA
jgi:hypothetical protein